MARGFNYAAGSSADATRVQEADLDREQIVEFASSRNPVVRERLAERADLPLGVAVTLVHDSVTDVRLALAGNASVSEAILEELAADKQRAVLIALAGNPRVPAALLERLSQHRRSDVRSAAEDAIRAGESRGGGPALSGSAAPSPSVPTAAQGDVPSMTVPEPSP
ncbi:hypothetical protein [Demequina sp. NBRC 110054]|uniref:hypothetical protein n=1 Tax=Demequina sp. NBRC 110054 TaxID=1570343 RepID=UPI000A0749A8|nr:hypothetical protein [Demequina sp. NBRC 110054]